MKVAPIASEWLNAYHRQRSKQATEQIPIRPPEGMKTSTIRSSRPRARKSDGQNRTLIEPLLLRSRGGGMPVSGR